MIVVVLENPMMFQDDEHEKESKLGDAAGMAGTRSCAIRRRASNERNRVAQGTLVAVSRDRELIRNRGQMIVCMF